MEASLLVAPKPSRYSLFFSSTRAVGKSRRFLIAATIHGKAILPKQDLDSRSSDRANNNARLLSSLVAAAAMVLPPCNDASAAAASEPPPQLPAELYRTVALLGDLDPATAKTVASVAGPALSAFGFLFILRIVMSWYPRLPVTKLPYVLAYAPTEPFLAVTRKVIPPLGGVDVTPVVWFGLLSFLNEILVGPQGLLILLSQQQQL